MFSNIHFFLGPLPIGTPSTARDEQPMGGTNQWEGLPPIGCSSLAVDSVLPRGSAELDILQPLLIIMTLRR